MQNINRPSLLFDPFKVFSDVKFPIHDGRFCNLFWEMFSVRRLELKDCNLSGSYTRIKQH